jgi:phospholipid/cholesterol/gamma-HCH transport system substrate-binding protein
MALKTESKVGILVFLTLLMGVAFAWLIGVENPFKAKTEFYVTYEFAGGVELGTPVRVSGIKVGKVEAIEFFVPAAGEKVPAVISKSEPGSATAEPTQKVVPIRLKLSIQKEAMVGVRQDSHFYINLAGIIGERFIEVTPGSQELPQVQPGEVLAGIDPPRIDQLLSQSFNLAGKLIDLVENNKGDIRKTIASLLELTQNVNKTLNRVEHSKIFNSDYSKLVGNLIDITTEFKRLTDKSKTPEGQKTLELLHKLLWRLEPLDSKAIKEFFHEEGVRVKFF